MSVWASAEALFDFAYRSEHQKVLRKRRQWFERPTSAFQALWWLGADELPGIEQGLERLDDLDRLGPSPVAFDFKTRFPPPDALGEPADLEPEPYCNAW